MVSSCPPRHTNLTTAPAAPGMLKSTGSVASQEGISVSLGPSTEQAQCKLSVHAEHWITQPTWEMVIITHNVAVKKLAFNEMKWLVQSSIAEKKQNRIWTQSSLLSNIKSSSPSPASPMGSSVQRGGSFSGRWYIHQKKVVPLQQNSHPTPRMMGESCLPGA